MKKLLGIILVFILALSLTGCGGTDKNSIPKEGKTKEEKTITIGVMPDIDSIPFIIAEKNGYFDQAGVNVKIEHFSSAKDRDSALQSGKLDGVINDVAAVVFANEGGIDLKMLAKTDITISLLAGKDSGIHTVGDLKGKTVGLSTNTIMEYTLDRMLEDANVQVGEIKKIAVPPIQTRLEMLQGGKLNAAIMPDPLAALAVKNGALILNSTDKFGYKAGSIAFTSKSIKESPEEIKAVFTAYNKAVDYLRTEPAESYTDFVVQAQSFPVAVKDTLTLTQYTHATAPDPEIVADVVKWMKSKELIKKDYTYQSLTVENFLR
ncbi:MAG TPA: MetQ/NlpA family ABC transporter substrate-binding protein [Syntrophomonas sp.]|nr:MetQ/NlpA family ABC transporter substrate-binding protein [Syntrophomonas sp.]